MRFALHPGAYNDLDEIREYIAYENPAAAYRILDQISDRFRIIANFPNSGQMRPWLTERPLRFHVVREYLIAYAPELTPVWIVAVIHGRRSPRLIASILNSRR